jgi:hypothetical protein
LSEVQVERESVGSEDWPVCVDLKSCVSIKETTGFEFWFLVLFFFFFFFFIIFLFLRISEKCERMRKHAKNEKRKTKKVRNAVAPRWSYILESERG